MVKESNANTAEGRADEEMGRLRSGMFVYGLLDLLTHFGISQAELKKDLSENAQGKTPRAFDKYWAIRDDIKKRMGPYIGPPEIKIREALFDLVSYFSRTETIIR